VDPNLKPKKILKLWLRGLDGSGGSINGLFFLMGIFKMDGLELTILLKLMISMISTRKPPGMNFCLPRNGGSSLTGGLVSSQEVHPMDDIQTGHQYWMG